jgi:hypothetical protein
MATGTATMGTAMAMAAKINNVCLKGRTLALYRFRNMRF